MRKPRKKIKDKSRIAKIRRKLAIRKRISGTNETPRICINRTNKHLNVQLIDDSKGVTILSAKTFGKKNVVTSAKRSMEGAKLVGNYIGDNLEKLKISSAVFDRNGYKYTGIIKALIESIREKGINV